MTTDIRDAILHDIVSKPFCIPDKLSTIHMKGPDGYASRMSRYYATIDKKKELPPSPRFRRRLTDGQMCLTKRRAGVYVDDIEMEKDVLAAIIERFGLVPGPDGKYVDGRIVPTDELYRRLLFDDLTSNYNESPYEGLEYTSLKYHTLLTTVLAHHSALHVGFASLALSIIPRDEAPDGFVSIFVGPGDRNGYAMVIVNTNDGPSARLGTVPMCNFGQAIGRLPYWPQDGGWPQLLTDARRIKSWSVGLQYLEDTMRAVGHDTTHSRTSRKRDWTC